MAARCVICMKRGIEVLCAEGMEVCSQHVGTCRQCSFANGEMADQCLQCGAPMTILVQNSRPGRNLTPHGSHADAPPRTAPRLSNEAETSKKTEDEDDMKDDVTSPQANTAATGFAQQLAAVALPDVLSPFEEDPADIASAYAAPRHMSNCLRVLGELLTGVPQQLSTAGLLDMSMSAGRILRQLAPDLGDGARHATGTDNVDKVVV